jgi:hypothetical protein
MLKNLFAPGSADWEKSKSIIVVSGLPRSGTSMMMKMLAEGGLKVVTDARRTADDDNPNGYFEFEPVKQMTDGNTRWLEEAQGGVVKVISALLEHLPANHNYKVIFMERAIQEVLASQKKMLANRREDPTISDAEMAQQFQNHLKAIKYWLARQPNLSVLYVDYNKMMVSPQEDCQRVADFIGLPVDVAKMLSVPNESLYRNRAK